MDNPRSTSLGGPSSLGAPGQSFQWMIRVEELNADTQYSIELVEVEGAAVDGSLPDVPPRIPASGLADLGLSSSPVALKLVVVPIDTPCQNGPALTPDLKAGIELGNPLILQPFSAGN